MLQKDLIQEFLKTRELAIVGVSRANDIPANYIYKKFKSAGYKVHAVNPNTREIEGDPCYPSVLSLDTVTHVFMAGTPRVSEECATECIRKGITHVWMHRGIGNGSYSMKAEAMLTQAGIKVITNGCPLMYLTPVDPFHRVLRWLKA